MKIVFDFDGTLVDSMPYLRARGVALISEAYNIPYSKADRWYMSSIGRSFLEQLDFLFSGDPQNEQVAASFEKLQGSVYKSASIYSGTIDTINFLNEVGVPYALCTSSISAFPRELFESTFPEFEGTIYGREMGTKRDQLKDLFSDITREERWFIGDTSFDAVMSTKVPCNFIGVTQTSSMDDARRMGFKLFGSIPEAVDHIVARLVGV